MELRNFFKKNNSKNTPRNGSDFEKKNNKFLKVFGCLALATFMTATALFAVAPFVANTSAATEKEHKNYQLTSEEMVFNPEKDETIFITKNGTEIKSHNIASSGTYTSLQYFTLGSYNGTPVNWIILAFNGSDFWESTSPAGSAIKSDTAKQMLVGQTNTSLLKNQLLCISQYAFPYTYNPNYVPHADVSYRFSSETDAPFSAYTDAWTDYYSSYSPLSLLDLASTLGLDAYMNTKILKNTAFNSEKVFAFTSSQYSSFVSNTAYKTPYKIDNTSETCSIILSDTHTGGVTSKTSWYDSMSGSRVDHTITGTGKAYAEVTCIDSTLTTSKVTVANFTGVGASTGGYYQQSSWDEHFYLHFKVTYTATNVPYESYCRPAMIVDFTKL